ncbi:MAG TPA: hypothetical protein DCM24_04795 [Synergistaceae bacterium]|nr:hypothetical protein [Synergistaceae bacterium]
MTAISASWERPSSVTGSTLSIYSDAHSIFFSAKPPRLTLVKELRGTREGLTQFGKALDILGTLPLKASSAQAKGRIERLWGTFQHRLVVDLRVAGVSQPGGVKCLPGFLHIKA